MTNGIMMKWRVRKGIKRNSVEHDDIRRSLEVLDSVLAEFDDCLESWDSLTNDIPTRDDPKDTILPDTKEIPFKNNSSPTFCFENDKSDGSTSQDSGLSLQEQAKVVSPPPVPKRSATTKLSDRNSGVFIFPLSNSRSFDSLQSDQALCDNDSPLSANDTISTLSTKSCEALDQNENNTKTHYCTKCGCEMESLEVKPETAEENDISSSPFSDRRKIFEDKIEETKINLSPILARSFASTFKVKKDTVKDYNSEPPSLSYSTYVDVECDEPDYSASLKAKESTPTSEFRHAVNCNCKERIQQLQIIFAETRRLLKANKIKGLDKKPPSFVPPLPPTPLPLPHAAPRYENQKSSNEQSPSLPKMYKISVSSNGSTNSDSLASEQNSSEFDSLDSSNSAAKESPNCDKQAMCRRCSQSDRLVLTETIEDLPKLLPTDTLKRPQLGLTCSMEDDLSPGVKEILQTSTPRNGISLSRAGKTTSLSTFSLSDSSTGYVSSQSDLELSHSPLKKVPVSALKCSTLPEGMDLHSLPSYYGHSESIVKNKPNQTMYRDGNFNHTSDPQLRSSSVSPLPEMEKPKKKFFRAFSRKTKDKKKNGESKVEQSRSQTS